MIKAGETIPDSWRENETNRYLDERQKGEEESTKRPEEMKCANCDTLMNICNDGELDWHYECPRCEGRIDGGDME